MKKPTTPREPGVATRSPRRSARRATTDTSDSATSIAAPPERSAVLELLRERGVPMTQDEIANSLEVQAEALLAFHNRLLAMERDGQLLRNRKGELCIVDKLDLVIGRIEGHPDGHGFLIRDDKAPDAFLNANEMRKVLNGDRASARLVGTDRRGRPEAAI